MKLHSLHQLFCQRQNLIFSTEDAVNSDTTGNLLEIQALGSAALLCKELAIQASLLSLGRVEVKFTLLSLIRKLDFQRQ